MKYSSIIKDIMEHLKNTKVSNYFDKIGPDYFDKKMKIIVNNFKGYVKKRSLLSIKFYNLICKLQ